ncbi:MAG: tetratricopeptide repeat protein, partial [Candidatus Krumholzibacteria bacterium]|nr:tetratricopeptide repeat protein [Candidatus Krumholzibacteria bacterium]
YFSDGITDDIIAQLSKIADLRVVSRTSVMRYKDTEKSLREIADELGVATILEGSVRRAQGQVRIVSQLIDARTDEHIWAESYDRELREIFKIQSDVAERIARALEATLTDDEAARIRTVPTGNMEAYDLYLRGRESYGRYHKEDNDIAVVFFERALDLDPDYALAYAGLGDAYAQRVMRFGFTESWLDSSIIVSKKAIAIDANLAEGYKSLGLAYMTKGWFRKGLEANLKAAGLDPNYHDGVSNVGWCYNRLGRPDQAIEWFHRAMEIEPSHPFGLLAMGATYAQLNEFEESRRWLRMALEKQPDLTMAHWKLIGTYLREDRTEEARALAEEVVRILPDRAAGYAMLAGVEYRDNIARSRELLETAGEIATVNSYFGRLVPTYLACTLWRMGERERALPLFEQARTYLHQQIENGSENSEMFERLSMMDAVQGKNEEALDWLQRAFDAGSLDYLWPPRNPFYAGLHDDERFKAMIAEVRARVEELRERVRQSEKPLP